MQAFDHARAVAQAALITARKPLGVAPVGLEVAVFDRAGAKPCLEI